MSIKYYYLHISLQAKDAFFGDLKQVYLRSSNLMDPFPARVLLEAERRYRKKLALEHVDKLSIFSGWHTSPLNPHYHYTLQGYNTSGWMAVTIEMEAANQGSIFSYGLRDWNGWLLGDHVEWRRLNFINRSIGRCLMDYKSTYVLRYTIATPMSDSLFFMFFLAADEEEAMLPFIAEYWDSHHLGGQVLENMRLRLWAAWLAKFPIDFIALMGWSSTKEDEEDCHHRKLRCIEAYLLRMGSLTDGCGLEMLRSTIAFLEEQEAMLHTSTSESLVNVVPEPTSDIVTPPRHSARLLALKDGSSPVKDSVVSLPLPVTPKKSTPVESDYSPTSTIFSPPKFPLCTYARGKCFRTKDVTEDLSMAMLAYPVVKRKKIDAMRPSTRGQM
ncbi:hypothetical protein EDD18DRAFT_1107309 [Armillaria luteobubalina]|uniref:Uncharacterized protein n=1 Tax=Armillaria luteobubalina TaxID=153913 RepID=A0AA39UV74_9AGAR|nr:hypothetical protein EDD18DRAFT_1107309 [Armillaria luteobubalina]